MLLRYYNQFDGQPYIASVSSPLIKVGRGKHCDIVLNSPFVDIEAVHLARTQAGWQVRVLGLNGCTIDNTKLNAGATHSIEVGQKLIVFPFAFQFDGVGNGPASHSQRETAGIHELVRLVHLDMLTDLHHRGEAAMIPNETEAVVYVERAIEAFAASHGLISSLRFHLIPDLAGECVRNEILCDVIDTTTSSQSSIWSSNEVWSKLATTVPDREMELRRVLHAMARRLYKGTGPKEVTRRISRIDRHFWEVWDRAKESILQPLMQYLALRHLKKQVKDILYGFGPLEDLLRIPTVSEIMVNSSQEIFIEKGGVIQNSGRQFVSDEVTLSVIERIVGRVNRRIDTAQPMVDARLPDGSRVNAIIPPLAVKGPSLTIRKFSREKLDRNRLLELGTINNQAMEFLQGCVRAKKSILISGGTGTGKTTLLNCLSQFIPSEERIVCIEDTHELQLDHPHVVFVECRDSNAEGRGKIVVRDLLKNALRQRPDRIIVGECRGIEALDMLQAMNTGHSGSMTTIHSNTPTDALQRLEILVQESGLSEETTRPQIVSAIDVIVQLTRMADGSRRVTEISEVISYDGASKEIRFRSLFEADLTQSSPVVRLEPTGCLPTFVCELVEKNLVSLDLFLAGRSDTQPVSSAPRLSYTPEDDRAFLEDQVEAEEPKCLTTA